MVYLAADNDLETYAIADLNELEMVGSTSRVSVVAQLDRSPGYDSSNGDWTTTRRYYVTKDDDTSTINSELIQDMGELDMAAPGTLTDFVEWATETYPGDHYLLVLWDHGRGWRTRAMMATGMQRQIKAIHIDDTDGSEMSLAELSEAFLSIPRMDVVLFDACLMGMLEVAYSIRDYADMMVASEENVPMTGQPYDRILSRLTSDPGISPYSFSMVMVDEYIDHYASYDSTFTASAIFLSSIDDVASAADQLAGAISANMDEVRSDVRTAQQRTQHYDFDKSVYDDYKDLYDFARHVRQLVTNAEVQSAAKAVMDAVNGAVLYQRSSGHLVLDSYGISIYLPDPGYIPIQYSFIEFAQDTQWDEFLESY